MATSSRFPPAPCAWLSGPAIDATSTTVDLNLEYSLVGGTDLALNVQNLFDTDPPFIVNARGTGYDPTNATALGRFVSLTMTHEW